MGVIVYLSDFGPLKNPLIPLWWDIVAVAGLSLVIFYWAMRVALPAARIERMIGEVVLPEEEDVAAAPAPETEPLSRDPESARRT